MCIPGGGRRSVDGSPVRENVKSGVRVLSALALHQNEQRAGVGYRLSPPAAKNGYTNLMPTSFNLLKRAMLRRRGVTLSTTDAARSGPAS